MRDLGSVQLRLFQSQLFHFCKNDQQMFVWKCFNKCKKTKALLLFTSVRFRNWTFLYFYQSIYFFLTQVSTLLLRMWILLPPSLGCSSLILFNCKRPPPLSFSRVLQSLVKATPPPVPSVTIKYSGKFFCWELLWDEQKATSDKHLKSLCVRGSTDQKLRA